jgi:hypothetical protein
MPSWAGSLNQAKSRFKDMSAWLARDVGTLGAKEYKGFSTLGELLYFADALKDEEYPTNFYELILDANATPVWAYFDADMPLTGSALLEALATDLDGSTEEVARALLSAFQDFMGSLGYSIILQPGINCQVGSQ